MKFIINGNKKTEGSIRNSGSKNSAVAIIPAAVLAEDDVILRNVPDIHDVTTLIKIIKDIGYEIDFKNNILSIKKRKKINHRIYSDEVGRLRGSYYFMGAFLGKLQEVVIKNCGGCNLGYRPINYHLEGFKKLGAKIVKRPDKIKLSAKNLVGCEIALGFPSVGATINIMLASVKARGATIIKNCAKEPEIIDVGGFLRAMGANISGLGTETIVVSGVEKLNGCDYAITSDRIEAGTYLIIGAMANGSGVTVKNCRPNYLTALIELLRDVGCSVGVGIDSVTVKKEKPLKPFHITTTPYPGFPTDLGPLISVLATQIQGMSTIKETIFSNRFSHVKELQKMGADIIVKNDTIYINGATELAPASLVAADLRGAAALVLAAGMAEGKTVIDNVEVMLRGYEKPVEKLSSLGVDIKLET
ncbi:MAG TPA: UDP-N-acetylglucosamine 1-carboxyvinyltransferase [Bacilli bacterium]|nr:UDP-N-acetylglucosamine 1-carboxyvinyltransferase [Bacilli bacterium]HPZ27708.1 UDP-N-acetylglucosamine 1-carboxyvinyltransferase [Bacilli bacterium]HQC90065.1 UDP-N-acetylglucosamine 1-carboxyvinyltransferase [Bacilli bacterium]